MNAVELITIRPIERPQFDNRHLADFSRWMHANTGTLAGYWRQLGQALGLGKDDEQDLDIWLRLQWEIERGIQVRSRLPHGESLL